MSEVYVCDRMGIGDKYCHLLMATPTYELLRDHPDIFSKNCNGVGSEVGLSAPIYHFIPNTILLLSITSSANIHDVEYWFPDTFNNIEEARKWKEQADHRFLCNMEIQIMMAHSWQWVENARMHRAKIYYNLVRSFGEESFMDGKTILNN